MLKSMRLITSKPVSLLLALAIALSPVSAALAQVQDTEAPVLIHRQIDTGVAGDLQTFLARVSDDFGIENVTLYYRQSDAGEFSVLPMRPLLDSIGEYMIAIETSVTEYRGLQYYIEAVDTAGNAANRGFAYAPIILPLTAPTALTANPTPSSIVEPPLPSTPVTQALGVPDLEINNTVLLVGVGALVALGALVLVGGIDSEPSPSTDDPVLPPTDTVTLTIISDVPSVN